MLRLDPWHQLVNAVLNRSKEAESRKRRIEAPTLSLACGRLQVPKASQNSGWLHGIGVFQFLLFKECLKNQSR